MLLVLSVMLVASMLAVLVLGAVTSQIRPTLVERQHVRALHASESGLDVALAQIQAATKPDDRVPTKTVGNLAQLPCTTSSTPLTGTVDGQPGGYGFAVQVRYFQLDPAGQSKSWRTTNAATTCPPSEQPRFALVTSAGTGAALPGQTAGSGSRTTELVYAFRVDNTNAVGGAITVNDKCWDAASASVGTAITLAACATGSERQQFAWRDDLTIILAGTAATAPLCAVTDPSSSSTTKRAVLLQSCDGSLRQMWGIDDSHNYYALVGSTTDKWCLDSSTSKNPVAVVATKTCTPVFTAAQAVGSGRSGSPTASQPETVMQWVNYAEYGRCVDVKNWTTTNDLQLFWCKQDPTTTQLRWNQGFVWGPKDSAGRSEIYTYRGSQGQDFSVARSNGSTRVCLQSSTSADVALHFVTCTSGQDQRWTVNREVPTTDGTGTDYTRSYTIVDAKGWCLGAGADTGTGAQGTKGYSSVRVGPCTGGPDQKWNAPPTFTLATQTDFRETGG